MSNTLLMATLLCVSASEPDMRPGWVAHTYSDILEYNKKAMRTAGRSQVKNDDVRFETNRRMAALLRTSSTLSSDELTSADCVALSGCAGHLRRSEDAVTWSKHAILKEKNVSGYIALMRALCNASRCEEAFVACEEALSFCSESQEVYLVPLMIALKLRAMGCREQAFCYFDKTLEVAARRCSHSPLLVVALKQCIEDSVDVAISVNMQARCKERMLQYYECVDAQRRQIITARGKIDLFNTPVDYGQFRRASEAVLALLAASDPLKSESVANDWCEALIGSGAAPMDKGAWFEEIKAFADAVEESLTPQVACTAILASVSQLKRLLVDERPEEEALLRSHAAALDRMVDVEEVLGQHVRLCDLKGRNIFPATVFNSIVNGGMPRFTLVHVLEPTHNHIQRSLQGIQWVRIGSTAIQDVEIAFVALQSGVSWDARTRQLIKSEGVSFQEESEAYSLFREAYNLPGPVRLIARDTMAFEALAFKSSPVTVLLDSRGEVVGALSGIERKRIARLVNLIR